MDQEQILLETERVIAFKPELVPLLGSIEAVLIYQQLCHWSKYSRRPDGFIYKTAKELEEETTVSKRKIHAIRNTLTEKGFVEVKKAMANGSNTYHWRVLKVPTTVLTSSSDRTSLPSDQNVTSITKNTHKNIYVQFDEEIQKLYKGWLIEMIVGIDVWLMSDESNRDTLLENAKAKVRLTQKRKDKAGARLDSLGFECCATAIKNIGKSDFHKGQNERKWKATFEWLFKNDERVEEWANR